MELINLRIKNITSFKDVEIDFSNIPPGLVAITGQNGAGKTTLLEAICFALLNETPSRDVSIYDQCSDIESSIHLTYLWDNKNYDHIINIENINPKKRKQEGYIYVDSQSVVNGKITDYKNYCNSIIIDPLMFFSGYFNSQNNKGDFLNLSVKDRKEIMINSLGLVSLSNAHDLSYEKEKQYRDDLGNSQILLEGLKFGLEEKDYNTIINELELNFATCKNSKTEYVKEIEILENEQLKVTDEVNNLQNIFNDFWKNREIYNNCISEKEKIEKLLTQENIKYSNLCKEIDRIKDICVSNENKTKDLGIEKDFYNSELIEINEKYKPLFNDIDNSIIKLKSGYDKDVACIQSEDLKQIKHGKINELSRLKFKILNTQKDIKNSINSEKTKLENDVQVLINKKNVLDKEIEILENVPCGDNYRECMFKINAYKAQEEIIIVKKDINNLNLELSRLPNVDIECNQKTLNMENLKLDLIKEIEVLDEKILFNDEEFKKNSIKFNNEINLLNSKKKALELEIVDKSKVFKDELFTINSKLKSLKINCKKQILLNLEKDKPVLKSKIVYNEEKIKDIQVVIDKCLAFDVYNNNKEELDVKKQELSEIKENLKSKKSQLFKLDSEILSIEKKLAIELNDYEKYNEKALKILEMEQKIEDLKFKVSDFAYLSKAFGRDGIQAIEIDAAGPEISQITNDLLKECFGNRFSVEFITIKPKKTVEGYREVFTINVRDLLMNHAGDIKEFSGGEKTIISIAVRLAIALFNCRKSKKKFKTLFFDEITSSLSDENSEKCAIMLEKARFLGDFKHVFFTVHNIKAIERANSVLEVKEGKVLIKK